MTSDSEQRGILGSSAVMAAGTVVSRMSGYVRNAMLVAALGAYLHADVFTIANTIPNMLYILLAGGVFNAVLVPQLVRAMRNDEDRGEAYTNRIITLAALFLGGVTVLLVALAPWVIRVFLSQRYFTPELAEQLESVVDFARYCLPQVFFYGMFVLVGQVLNARHRFGPMMWAPIANNVIAVAVLAVYLVVFGPASDLYGGYTPQQELLLGLGSTAGIAVQLAVLVPYLRKAGFHYRPRFDFRGTGLGHTLRLGTWTVGFVIVNQLAYTVVVRLASSGTAGAVGGEDPGTGYTIYSQAFLLIMVPHSVVTVSLATAILPRLSARAADGDLSGVAEGLVSTMRTALAVIFPVALLVFVVAEDLANLGVGWGAGSGSYRDYVPPLMFFAVALVFFTVHFLMLRGMYSLERTRTVFWVQCVIAGTNVAAAVLITRIVAADRVAGGLALAYALAYAVGALVSYAVLRRLLGGLNTRSLLVFLARLLVVATISVAGAWALHHGLGVLWGGDTKLRAVVVLLACGLLAGGLFLLLARLLRLTEVTAVMHLVTRRLGRGSGPTM